MRAKLALMGGFLLVLTACGADDRSEAQSKEDTVVMESRGADPMTYKDVREQTAKGFFDGMGVSCVEIAAFGEAQREAKFPAGQALFVEACEAGMKLPEGSAGLSPEKARDQQIITRNTENGTTKTYADVRNFYAAPERNMTGIDCAEFLTIMDGLAAGKIEYPAGKGLYIQACEEGGKLRNARFGTP